MENNGKVLELAAQIVAAYVGNNVVAPSDIPRLIADVHRSLEAIAAGLGAKDVTPELKPAVNARKSITPDYLICLEDGKKFKSLKRHLRTEYDMSPDQYRAKWGLPPDYPMVAPNYSEARSRLAKSIGLGRKAAVAPVVVRRGPKAKVA